MIKEKNFEMDLIERKNFDEWFSDIFPQYISGNKPLEPYYSIASLAYEVGRTQVRQNIKNCLRVNGLALQSDMDEITEQNLALKKELEKENIKLKEHIVDLEKANKTLSVMNENMWVELEKKRAESQGITNRLHQFAQAKEIIKLLLYTLKNEASDYTFALKNTHPVLQEAEQFLKECK